MKKFTRKIRRLSSHSYGVSIPKEIIKKFGWRLKQKLVISFGGRKEELKIKDWEKAQSKKTTSKKPKK